MYQRMSQRLPGLGTIEPCALRLVRRLALAMRFLPGDTLDASLR
jgi:hypothetical protein